MNPLRLLLQAVHAGLNIDIIFWQGLKEWLGSILGHPKTGALQRSPIL